MKRTLIFIFLAIFLYSPLAFAGGTVSDEELDLIIGQQPELAKFIRTTLEFCKASWYAEVRLSGNYPLGGTRLGPFTRRCRPKDWNGNFDFILTVNTTYKGYDANGKEVDVKQAIKIDQKLTSIELRYAACEEDWCKTP